MPAVVPLRVFGSLVEFACRIAKPSTATAISTFVLCTADAGADLDSWRSEDTEYDLVQTAANMGDLDAALKLVEAGCKWQLPKGQRSIDGSIFYAPEILKCHVPNLKVSCTLRQEVLCRSIGCSPSNCCAPVLVARLQTNVPWCWLLAYNPLCHRGGCLPTTSRVCVDQTHTGFVLFQKTELFQNGAMWGLCCSL
jgi:hypothetical protein